MDNAGISVTRVDVSSYINIREAGATFLDWNGNQIDDGQFFAQLKEAGMRVLIDFHYSDFWANPAKQQAPKTWEDFTAITTCGTYTVNGTER